MGKTGKWLKNFFSGKKEKEKDREEKDSGNQSNSISAENPTTPILIPPTTPKEKKRWSFRRSAMGGTTNCMDSNTTTTPVVQTTLDSQNEQKKHAMAIEEAKATVIRLTTVTTKRPSMIKEVAAIKIQANFRSYLARKALHALKGLVKLQALVRGHLVRKQATATLRCMQALVTVQARALAQRIRMVEETQPETRRQSIHRQSLQNNRFRKAYNEGDGGIDDNIKIVEMDLGELQGSTKSRNSYSNHHQLERADPRFSTYYGGDQAHSKHDHQIEISPAPSALTDMSPKAYSGHFEEYSFTTMQSSPGFYSVMSKPDPTQSPFAFPQTGEVNSISHDYTFFPNYMAYTESSRAKVRSQSAPKQRPDSFERQLSRRRGSIEGRNVPRHVKMQRSSSHVGATSQGYQHPWSIKLDRSTMSLKGSECGSTSTVLTNTNYCRSLVAYQPHE